jgi:hypothetical protein
LGIYGLFGILYKILADPQGKSLPSGLALVV